MVYNIKMKTTVTTTAAAKGWSIVPLLCYIGPIDPKHVVVADKRAQLSKENLNSGLNSAKIRNKYIKPI